MKTDFFPRMITVRQKFKPAPTLDFAGLIERGFGEEKLLTGLKPKARVAVAVGSRGITNLKPIVRNLLDLLKRNGSEPFIIPAMGSHGGATPEGQICILAEYGISTENLGVPILGSMEVSPVGRTEEGLEVCISTEALKADGIILINRVKPHTDFQGQIGSGLMKMMVIGLGKRAGAAAFHGVAGRFGYERMIRSIARVILQQAHILGGIALVENELHDTARLAVVHRNQIEAREEELFAQAQRLMPKLPFPEIDLLVIDRIGKNISGAGMDPNVIGRDVHGYSSFLGEKSNHTPHIRRILVRDLTPETHGNGIGIGLADLTTTRLVQALDKQVTYINALTSLTPNGAKIPIHFDTDREAITHAIESLALDPCAPPKIVRIQDTLNLQVLQVSEAFAPALESRTDLERFSPPTPMDFDTMGNLRPL